MNKWIGFIGRLVREEQGGEMVEYALLLGLIFLAGLSVMGSFGGKVLARWTSLSRSM